MKVNKIKLKIYLKYRKMPLTADIPSEKYVDDFLNELSSIKEFITFGEITFKREDIRLVIIKEKK